MSVDMAHASMACRVGGSASGVGCRLRDGRRAFAAALFSSYALRRGSVRAARRFMRALSGKFVFHLPAPGAERMGARVEDRYGEVWKAHWHGSVALEAFKRSRPARNA